MGMLRDGLMPETMVRITDDLYLPSNVLAGMSALDVAGMIRQRGGLGPSLDTAGIQSSQEMFNEVFGQAMADEIMNQLLETQGVPDVVEFTTEDMLRNVIVEDGISQSEIDYVTDLLQQGLVTIADVSARTGIPAEEIQAVYEQQRREPSVLELLQTGPVQPLDVEGGIGDVAGTGDVTDEEVVDLSQRTTDDLTEDTTASTVDGDAVDMEEPSRYSWIYEDGGFVYAPFDVGGNRLPGGERIPASDVAGTEGRTFEEGQNVNVLFLPDGTATLEDVQDTTDEKVSVFGDITGGLVGTGGITGGGLVGDTVVQTPTGTPGTVLRPVTGTGDGGGDVGDGVGDGLGDGVGDGDGVRSELIMRFSQQAPITEQMFSRELFEPKLKELDNVAKAIGLLQDIARGFA